jgi:two-component system, NarL family, sensor histidine kinase DevS
MIPETLSREELQKRLIALHQASLELVQDISVESLLKRIAQIACDQVGARYAAVGVMGTDGSLEQFISVGVTEAQIAKMTHPPRGVGLIGALMNSTTPIRLANIQDDPRSYGSPEHHPTMTSFLGVPIRQGELALGQIYLTNKLDGAEFSADDEMIIEMLASYAAVAITNARLYKELIQRDRVLTRRNENFALLNQLASTLTTSTDVDQILKKALSQVLGYLRLELGEIYLLQEDTKTLKRMHHYGKMVDSIFNANTFQVGEGMVGMAARTNQPRLANVAGNENQDFNPGLFKNNFHQVACLPLAGRQGVLGVLCVVTLHPQPLDELEMQFLMAISAWVGAAIENVRFSMQGLRLAVLEERERIGMDLHDGVIQSIYAVGLTLEHARLLMNEDSEQANQRINQAVEDLNKTIRDIRAFIMDLRPRQLHDENLMLGIQRLVNEFHANTLLEANLQGPSGEIPGLTEAPAVALFHICQEALANISKHAHAKHVDVVVWYTQDRVLLEIRDDGRGFEAERIKISLGHGLSNMQTRAHNVGGDVDITSEASGGTAVMAWVPLKHEK